MDKEKGLKIDDFKMVCHLNMKSEGQLHYKGIINAPHHILNGKDLWKVIITPKNKSGEWGKGKATFYVGRDKKGFEDFNELIKHYNLPELELSEKENG